MQDYIDSAELVRSGRRRWLWVLAGVLLVLLIVGRTALADWVDLLWFQSLGYGEVFWKTLGLELGVFAIFSVVTFLLLYGASVVVRRAHQADMPSEHAIIIAGRRVSLSVAPALRWISLIVSAVIALLTGLALAPEWPTLALFWYAPKGLGAVADPVFGRGLEFFLFTLPAWQLIDTWLLTLALAMCAVALLFLVITSGARSVENRRFSVAASPWRGLSLTGSFLLLVLAVTVYVDRFAQLLEHHTLFDGVTYTDAHVTIPGLLIVCVALLLGAALAAVNGVRESRGTWIAAAVAPAAVCYLALGIVGWYVSSFVVKPNQLVREGPYIAHNIELTRRAFGLDKFQQSEFPAETTVDATDPRA